MKKIEQRPDHGGLLEFKNTDTFLGDAMTFADRCASETGEMHVLFKDKDNGIHCQHICQPYRRDWKLIYSANPYPFDG